MYAPPQPALVLADAFREAGIPGRFLTVGGADAQYIAVMVAPK
jgi:hypothetical protein